MRHSTTREHGPTTATAAVVVVVVALALVLVGCSSSKAGTDAGAKRAYYVSLGDSYGSGDQVIDASGRSANTRNGFAYQVPPLAKAKGYDLQLVNFACGGATTTSILDHVGCAARSLGPDGTAYDHTTQIAAAEAFLRAHRGHVGLITVSIGGNDVTACAQDRDPIPCVVKAVGGIKTNVTALAKRLRAAAGGGVPIVGTTYPDVILADYLAKSASARQLAELSVTAFKSFINPALKAAYASAQGEFVDVTAASGAYGSLEETTSVEGYGTIPVPVAKVCHYSYMCRYQNIHATTAGYRLIAQLVVDTLAQR